MNEIFCFCLGILLGYVIRLFVEDTDKKYEDMGYYQNIIDSLRSDDDE